MRIALFIFLLLPVVSFGRKQGQPAIDSMLSDLPKSKEDTNKVKLLYGLSVSYNQVNPNEGIIYAQQTLDLATKLNWQHGIAMGYTCLGGNYFYTSDYRKALEYDLKGLDLAEKYGYDPLIGSACINMGHIYRSQGDFPKALICFEKTIKVGQRMGNKAGIASCNVGIGNIYYDQADYPKAMEHYFKALKLYEEAGNKQGIAAAYLSIGKVYPEQKEYQKALECDEKALQIFEALGDKHGVASLAANMGFIYSETGDYTRALQCFFKALKIVKEIGDKDGIATIDGNIAGTYSKQGNYALALEYQNEALQICEELGDKKGIETTFGNISFCYLSMAKDTVMATKPGDGHPMSKRKKLLRVIDYAGRALEICNQTGDLACMQNCYNYRSEAYGLIGENKNALKDFQQYILLRDSIFSNENKKKITNLEHQRELDMKEAKIRLLEQQNTINQLAVARKRTEQIFYITGICLLISVIGLLLRGFYAQAKSNKLLAREKKRSDDLLLNILPSEVAEELKENGHADAKLFDDVTVLFTDFVGFTKAGEWMTPKQLVSELDSCFKAFDAIMGKYGIEKIKTVGDAYLAVSGLPAANSLHGEHVVNAAIEIRQFMKERKLQLNEGTFEIRIGIHTGSVVAGIVGIKKFAYDIWGDTVNTAARMEQNSESGKINISECTYELVKDKFQCTYRGQVAAKHKGELSMYFVESRMGEPGA